MTETGRPVRYDTDGGINDPTHALTLQELARPGEHIYYPVWDDDFVNQDSLNNKVYVINRAGQPLIYNSTTLGTDYTGQDPTEPTNFEMEIEEELNQAEFFCYEVYDCVTLTWSVLDAPQDQYPKGEPGITITGPNGKLVRFVMSNNTITPVQINERNFRPNVLRIECAIPNIIIRYRIHKLRVPADMQNQPNPQSDWEDTVRTGKMSEYVHVTTSTAWIFGKEDHVNPEHMGEMSAPRKDSRRKQAGTRRFRVGSNDWFDCRQDIPPGSYVVLVTSVGDPKEFFIKSYNIHTLNLIPKSKYFYPQSAK